MGEGCILVVVGIDCAYVIYRGVALSVGSNEDATGEASALGDEQYTSVIVGLQLMDGLVDLQQVLMGESLIYGDIVVAPRKMGGGTRLLPRPSAARDAIDMDIATDNTCTQRRKHCQLNAGGKAAWIGQMGAICYG